MFKIFDGRDRFYQWDVDRKLIVEDSAITEVHFCNRTDSCSLVCQVYEENGLTLVNVPNILLQTDWRINVYAYDKNYTKHSGVFEVVKRTKPTDYVYTETEIITWETIEAKIDAIYNNIDGVVKEYLDENPIQVDLSNYYDKAETDDAIEQAVAAIPEPDLSDYAKKSEIPSTSGLATEKYVDDAIAQIDIPDTDLSNYYTKTETNAAIKAAQPDLSGYAKKSDIPSTAGLATEQYVQEQIKKIDIPDTDLSNYYNKQEVDAKIPDTSGFALKSEIPDTSKFITEVPAEYITETELNAAGYQTETQVKALITAELGVIENGTY